MSVPRFLNIFLLTFLFTCIAYSGEKQPLSANAFFKEMGNVTTLSADFIQEQEIRGLKKPIRLSGHLYMTNQGDLAWIVKSPIRFYCVIYKGKLTVWDEESGSKKSINLGNHPAFSTMINMMKDFFAGKIMAEKDYSCKIISARKIILHPLTHNPLADNVSKIELTLSADRRAISTVSILTHNGDRSTMRFLQVILDKPIPETVWINGESK